MNPSISDSSWSEFGVYGVDWGRLASVPSTPSASSISVLLRELLSVSAAWFLRSSSALSSDLFAAACAGFTWVVDGPDGADTGVPALSGSFEMWI